MIPHISGVTIKGSVYHLLCQNADDSAMTLGDDQSSIQPALNGSVALFRQPITPTAHYADNPLLRQPITPTTHYSDSPYFRQPIILLSKEFSL
jgi:hypothetical protein